MINQIAPKYFLSFLIATSLVASGLVTSSAPHSTLAGQTKRKRSSGSQRPSATQNPESWRRTPPAPAPEKPLRLPTLREVKLDNGLTLMLIENRRAPLVTINLSM